MLKKCTKCGEEKPATTEFFPKREKGLRATCRICTTTKRKKHYEDNKEQILERNKDYIKRNSEKVAEIRKEYYENNKVAISKWQKKYNEENREAILENKKEYRLKNYESILEKDRKYYYKNKNEVLRKNKIWRKNNKKRIRLYSREWARKERKNNPQYRLKQALCARLNIALRQIKKSVLESETTFVKIEKADSTFNLIGCDLYFLKDYLEKQFDENMNWANYGPYWHVDHIRPCASFDLTDHEQQRICFHYSNLQPLEAKENMRKGAKWGG